MEKIVFTHTVPCSECRGKLYQKRYNDSQSPCYHCNSITVTKHESKPAKTPEDKIAIRRKRDYKIMELHTSGKSYGEIACATGVPRSTVHWVIKHYEHA